MKHFFLAAPTFVLLAATAFAAATPPPPAGRVVPLSQLVQDALHHNLTLRSQRATTQGIVAGVDAARSIFDPVLSAGPAYSRGERELLTQPGSVVSGIQTTRSVTPALAGQAPLSTSYSAALDTSWSRQLNSEAFAPGQAQPSANTTLSLSVTQPLLRGFGPGIAGAPVRQAEMGADAARERLQRTMEQTISAVEGSYWNLGLNEAIERLSRDSYERAKELAGRNEKMLELKLITDLDAITSRRGLQSRLAALIDAERRRQDALEALLFLVYGDGAVARITEEAGFRTEPPPTPAAPASAVGPLETDALRTRADVRAARRDLESTSLAARVARNALLPDVRLTGGYTAQVLGTDRMRLFQTSRLGDIEFNGWSAQLNVSYPIRNRAARAANARARYEHEAQQLNFAATETNVRAEVRAARRAVDANLRRFREAELAFRYAKEQYAGSLRQLQLGLIDSFRLLQVDEDVTAAELTLEQARYELVLAGSNFELATGLIGVKHNAPSELGR